MTPIRRTAAPLLAVTEDLARTGSWVFDLGSRETVWSEGMYRILGLLPGEEGRTEEDVFEYVHPEDRERMQRLLAEVTARGGHRARGPDAAGRRLGARASRCRAGGP